MAINDPLISIVVPIYNTENYLSQCTASVLAQTMDNFELILVDDGSTDQSGKICDQFSLSDHRIKVIHKTNQGLGQARNTGISHATGEWLMFLDSDDYWDDDQALKKVITSISSNSNIDVVMFQAKHLQPGGVITYDRRNFDHSFNKMARFESLSYLVSNALLTSSACVKIVKRTFLTNNELFFKPVRICEDLDWVIRLANCLPTYHHLDEAFYIYRKGRPDSLSYSLDLDRLYEIKEILTPFLEFEFSDPDVKNALLSYISFEYAILCALAANLREPRKKALIKSLEKMQFLFKYDMNPKIKKVKLAHQLLGFQLTVFVLGQYLKTR